MSKEEMAEIMIKIISAIKEVMRDGQPTILFFSDAKITIEKIDEQQ